MDKKDKPGGNYITQAWLVILLALLYGGALAGVQIQLGSKIADNKRNETYDRIPALVCATVKVNVEELLVMDRTGKEARVYKANDADGNLVGWVVPASGQGFADRIEVLVGLSADLSTITGLFVLDQKETPGLGDYITHEFFRTRFVGKSSETSLEVVTGDAAAENQIQALTGATISSQSVADIVNKTIDSVREPILEQMNATDTGKPEN